MTTVLCVGIATLDIVFAVPKWPLTPGKHRAGSRNEVGGGVAANAAVTVVRLGGGAVFAGRLGDDPDGDRIVAGLEAEGVGTRHVQRVAGSESPMSVVFIDETGERTIVNHAGADLFAGGTVSLPEVDAVLSDMRWPGGGEAALVAAQERMIPGVLDCDHDPTGRERTLRAASHVVFALPTLAAFVGADDPGEGLHRAAQITDAWLAVTAGADGTYWREGGTVRHAPAFPIDAVDTLGAGDVFHGAFALGLAEGMTEAAALRFGSAAAAIKCTRFGGRAGIPSRAEVDEFLERR